MEDKVSYLEEQLCFLFYVSSKEIIKKYRHIKKLDKTIIDEFINTIYIGKLDEINNTRDIEIEWNFQF